MYWGDRQVECFDARSRKRHVVDLDIIEALSSLDDWTTIPQFRRRHPDFGSTTSVGKLFKALVDAGMLEQYGAGREWPWTEWREAAFFHSATRVSGYGTDLEVHDHDLRRKALTTPPPPSTKAMRGEQLRLPVPQPVGDLARTLRARRTWRNFSSQPVPLSALSTLLQLTWGVQKHGVAAGQGPVVLKTSPSGGARHPAEAYVIALNIGGLQPGVFHYDAAGHHLTDLHTPISQEIVTRALGGQAYFARASALIVMSAIFARSMWRYSSSRAYRVLLADLGHLAQTFCLVATAMRLAPFCTMAFDDDVLDGLIQVDGVNETSMYVVGVGMPPAGGAIKPGRMSRRNG